MVHQLQLFLGMVPWAGFVFHLGLGWFSYLGFDLLAGDI